MRVSPRGRAILRQISAHHATGAAGGTGDARDTMPTFRTGDFLLTSSAGGLARLLGYATRSKVNHAAVIVDGEGTLIEANPSLFCHGEVFRYSSVRHYLKRGQLCWIGYVEVREGSRQEVADYAEHLLRATGSRTSSGRFWLVLHTLCSIAPRTYASRLSASSSLRRFLEHRAIVMRADLCYSSGELVARSLERGGFIWEHDPAQVTPADIFRRYRQPELSPVTPLLKPAHVARESLAVALTKSGKRNEVVSITSASQNPESVTAPSASTAAPPSRETQWQVFCGIGAATIFGLVCVDFLEQLIRSMRRKA
ncbi:MAG: hypothetical protein ACLQUY_25645 [Ktedonobacterales bacterium]